MKRLASGIMLTLLLIGMLAFHVQPVKAQGTIYIRADGSIDPPTANITTTDNVTYTFTDNSYDSIVVERSNIIVDGDGYTLQGSGSGNGFYWTRVDNVTIKNANIEYFSNGIFVNALAPLPSSSNSIFGNNITANSEGIYLAGNSLYNNISGNNITNNSDVGIGVYKPDYNSISGNNITNNGYGISLSMSLYNNISGNSITNNQYDGIFLGPAYNNDISGNNITDNGNGIWLTMADYNNISGNNITNNGNGVYFESVPNKFFHNNFVNNNIQVYSGGSANTWDDGYPSGGNYWSDYNGSDASHDGIGDTPYIIDSNNQDNYPLIHPYGSVVDLNTSLTYLTIQSAINAPETLDGHTIFVRNGTYYEHVLVNKSVSLLAESRSTIVDGSGNGTVFTIDVNNVTVSGFTIQNTGITGWGDLHGVTLSGSSGCTIVGNDIVNAEYGIYLYHSSENSLVANYIRADTPDYKDGIRLYSSSENSITHNTMRGLRSGVWLFDNSQSNELKSNDIMALVNGMAAFGSPNNTFESNEVETSYFPGSGYSGCFYIYGTTNNSVIGNTIKNNPKGITLWNAFGNSIYHNNFLKASFYFMENVGENIWDDRYPSGGNYWSDYAGADANGDGIGDTPYIIDSNNTDNYPLMNPWTPPDIAAINLAASKTVVGEGFSISVNVTVENQGNKIEAFNVSVYANATLIKSQVILLTGGNSTVLTLDWNTTGFAKGNYTISAYAEPVPSEIDTADNNCTGGTVTVTVAGDVTGEGLCDMQDISILIDKFMATPADPLRWDPNCDVNNDLTIDMADISIAIDHFMQS